MRCKLLEVFSAATGNDTKRIWTDNFVDRRYYWVHE